MKSKLLIALFSVAFIFTSLITNSESFAQSTNPSDSTKDHNQYVISDEAIEFLKKHNVDLTPFQRSKFKPQKDYPFNLENSYNEDILSFKQQVDAYGFNDEQVQQYVKGLVTSEPIIVRSEFDVDDVDREFSTYSTPPYSSRVAAEGLGYEVKSKPGYYQMTSYATIPSAHRVQGTSGYMFDSVSSSASGNWVIDVGLWYSTGDGKTGWRVFYNDGKDMKPVTHNPIPELTPGKQVYFNVQVRTDGYLDTKILDAANFSKVYAHFIYYVGDRGIYRGNAVHNKQITIATDNRTFDDGSYLLNAQFTNAHLYSTTGYSQFNSNNTESNRRGVFGPNNTIRNQVTVNSYTPWHTENISIRLSR